MVIDISNGGWFESAFLVAFQMLKDMYYKSEESGDTKNSRYGRQYLEHGMYLSSQDFTQDENEELNLDADHMLSFSIAHSGDSYHVPDIAPLM